MADLLELDRLGAHPPLAGLQAGGEQQVVDQRHQAQRAALERGDELRGLARRHAFAGGRSLQKAVAQQLDRGELRRQRRLELVREVGEDRLARPPPGLLLGLVAQHQHLRAADRRRAGDDDVARDAGLAAVAFADRAHALDRRRRAAAARVHDRAAVVAGQHAVDLLGAQQVAAEASARRLRVHAEQRRGLCIEIGHATFRIDGEHALDDAGEHRARLGLAPLELRGGGQQAPPHLLERAGEAAHLDARRGVHRRAQVALPDAAGFEVGEPGDQVAGPIALGRDPRQAFGRGLSFSYPSLSA